MLGTLPAFVLLVAHPLCLCCPLLSTQGPWHTVIRFCQKSAMQKPRHSFQSWGRSFSDNIWGVSISQEAPFTANGTASIWDGLDFGSPQGSYDWMGSGQCDHGKFSEGMMGKSWRQNPCTSSNPPSSLCPGLTRHQGLQAGHLWWWEEGSGLALNEWEQT